MNWIRENKGIFVFLAVIIIWSGSYNWGFESHTFISLMIAGYLIHQSEGIRIKSSKMINDLEEKNKQYKKDIEYKDNRIEFLLQRIDILEEQLNSVS